jgi:hypothetical protein
MREILVDTVLKARIVEEGKTWIARFQQPKQKAVARQCLYKHVFFGVDIHTQQ